MLLMKPLSKKIDELFDLLKAVKAGLTVKPNIQSPMQSIPKIEPVKAPSIKPSKASEAKLPGVAPDAKKDPKKIAQQIKDGSMSTKTQKVMLKSETLHIADNGQWSLI